MNIFTSTLVYVLHVYKIALCIYYMRQRGHFTNNFIRSMYSNPHPPDNERIVAEVSTSILWQSQCTAPPPDNERIVAGSEHIHSLAVTMHCMGWMRRFHSILGYIHIKFWDHRRTLTTKVTWLPAGQPIMWILAGRPIMWILARRPIMCGRCWTG